MIKQKHLASITKKSIKELVAYRNNLKRKLFDLKVSKSLKNLKNTSEIKVARRQIAQVQTILHSKITQANAEKNK